MDNIQKIVLAVVVVIAVFAGGYALVSDTNGPSGAAVYSDDPVYSGVQGVYHSVQELKGLDDYLDSYVPTIEGIGGGSGGVVSVDGKAIAPSGIFTQDIIISDSFMLEYQDMPILDGDVFSVVGTESYGKYEAVIGSNSKKNDLKVYGKGYFGEGLDLSAAVYYVEDSNNGAEVSVECNGDDLVLSGGCGCGTGSIEVSGQFGLNGWSCRCSNSGNHFADAICLKN